MKPLNFIGIETWKKRNNATNAYSSSSNGDDREE